VVYDAKGKCKGYGYVQFEDKEIADAALNDMNGRDVAGSKIGVVLFKAQGTRNSSYNNLFVKFIPKTYADEDLKNLFSSYGEIINAVVMKEKSESTENKGKTLDSYASRMQRMPNMLKRNSRKQIEGQMLYVAKALGLKEHRKKKREERYQQFKDCNLYVKNFDESIKDEDLKKAFELFGNVLSAKVMMEANYDTSTGKNEYRSKCFGFVCFSNAEEAKRAIAAAESQEILGRKLVVAITERKEDRAARFMQELCQFRMGVQPLRFPVLFVLKG
jgi:polyadenylate-binding protein